MLYPLFNFSEAASVAATSAPTSEPTRAPVVAVSNANVLPCKDYKKRFLVKKNNDKTSKVHQVKSCKWAKHKPEKNCGVRIVYLRSHKLEVRWKDEKTVQDVCPQACGSCVAV